MTFFEWEDRFSVDIKTIDDQHKKLISLINELNEVIDETNKQNGLAAISKEISAIVSSVDQMEAYAKYHFSNEERYMIEYSYGGYKSHKKAHESFFESVQKFQRDIDEGRVLTLKNLADFLKEWLTEHILHTDKKLKPFLKKKSLFF